jgi:cytochrome c biogenesis protein CcdA/glutaredoxin
MMKKTVLLIIIFIISCFFTITPPISAKEEGKIYFFYGTGCPHCIGVEEFLETEGLYDRYPIEAKEVYFNRDNTVFFNSLLDKLKIPNGARGVPTVVIGDKVITGDKPIITNFVSEANNFLEEASIQNEGKIELELEEIQSDQKQDLTLVAIIAASIVDAVNPCAFAVLIILMTTILLGGDKKKALVTGLAFAASIFISYFLMGLGLYKALGIGNLSGLFYKIIGWVAILLGIFNFKDYFWYGKGFLMEVPMSWRPKMKSLIKSTTSPLGAFGVGFIVSLFLLPCTSGPYIVILGMLAKNALQLKAILYLILYNLIFVSPMILISWAVYKGFNPNKAEEVRQKHLKTLHLIAGIIMLIMGIFILNS